ncbi:cobalamin biosynthesis protein CobG [Sphingomonas sp. TDK1]|uniref:cobalamin biosynthesis protein CobG n=1 Tax=Sphingomonas sp. TDK1 TaxID=453247 RepID=UPI0007D99EE9|nr:cobalamin biosynthesis protein CobG [Sphingomonas sp. TDK1]OAN60019.1 cobalamin biosynthesis protein CobG [Sphingomonas sp. TDK1]
MSAFVVRGWCPDAWRPMAAGDGLLVRVKPRLGRLTRAQLLGLSDAATAYGNGLIDVTSRANLQLRGVSGSGWRVLVERLIALDLVDADPVREKRRTLLVAPDWQVGDDTHRIATDLLNMLEALPDLPGKLGFVIDAGAAPLLGDAPGDFRIERGSTGSLILRAEGRACGAALVRGEEAASLVRLAHWFVESGGTAVGRMGRHGAALPAWAAGEIKPAAAGTPIMPGPHLLGTAVGVPFGQIDPQAMAALAADTLVALRITPWRVLLAEGATMADPRLITDAADPLLRTDACVGAPACPQASIDTRTLARTLAPFVSGRLHVSGCAKGCARAGRAEVVVTGRDGMLDLAFDARAGAPAAQRDLHPSALLSLFGTD